jgi:hypothetical protein
VVQMLSIGNGQLSNEIENKYSKASLPAVNIPIDYSKRHAGKHVPILSREVVETTM